MQKINRYWIVILLSVVLLGTAFYWFQYRPFKARRDCAWKRMHTEAIPYKPATGSQQIRQACIDTCQKQNPGPGIAAGVKEWACERESKCDDLYIPEQKAEPVKDWWGQMNLNEYKSCLRGKGF